MGKGCGDPLGTFGDMEMGCGDPLGTLGLQWGCGDGGMGCEDPRWGHTGTAGGRWGQQGDIGDSRGTSGMQGWGLRTPVGDTGRAVWGQEASEDRGEGTGGHIGDTVGAVGDTVGTHWGQLGTHVQPAAVADGEGSQQSIVGLQAGQQLPASSTQLQLHPRGRNPHHQLQLLLWGHTGSYRVTQGSYRVPQSPMGSYRVLWGPKVSVGSITATAHPPPPAPALAVGSHRVL